MEPSDCGESLNATSRIQVRLSLCNWLSVSYHIAARGDGEYTDHKANIASVMRAICLIWGMVTQDLTRENLTGA